MKKFNPYSFVSTEKYSPALQGLYYCNGFITATDRYVLITYKNDYNPEYEGKIIAKDGSIIPFNYVNFKQVIPEDNGMCFFDISYQRLIDIEQEYKADKKLKNVPIGIVEIKGVYFTVIMLAKIARFALNFGITKFGVKDGMVKVGKITDGQNIALIMPCTIIPAGAKIYSLNEQN